MVETNPDRFYNLTLHTIGLIAKLPVIRVNRKAFLKKQFSDSPDLNIILKHGPQAVYPVSVLEEKAHDIINKSTTKTSMASFAAGLPANPIIMAAVGGADVVQYFAFAINMAQQIAYIFGEDELFGSNTDTLPEEDKVKLIIYLGVMFGTAGAASMIATLSKKSGESIGKRVAIQAAVMSTRHPLVKKVGSRIGHKITTAHIEKTVTKAVPIIGGIISGGLTYATFKPLGYRLAKVLAQNLKNNPQS
ncbi:hypothetical protein EFN57_05720 [Leuconostoc citreum]|uniref:hypothetical protein n=1 Tax=Leuconostoc citreum TaxID=33964 RepID=UPI0021A400A5|nr:hypothetical protein [Leuconostoc citreum]MCT3054837.1 hypothetical protein [Leuconostoc citreum]MCT3062473.1 hypothetical protein [Leuconostoc citreum]